MSDIDINTLVTAQQQMSSEFGQLRGTLDLYMKMQAERDERMDKRIEALTAATEKTKERVDKVSSRLTKYRNLAAGASAAVTGLWGLAKLIIDHGAAAADTVDKLKR